jgi:hypothetical protein
MRSTDTRARCWGAGIERGRSQGTIKQQFIEALPAVLQPGEQVLRGPRGTLCYPGAVPGV